MSLSQIHSFKRKKSIGEGPQRNKNGLERGQKISNWSTAGPRQQDRPSSQTKAGKIWKISQSGLFCFWGAPGQRGPRSPSRNQEETGKEKWTQNGGMVKPGAIPPQKIPVKTAPSRQVVDLLEQQKGPITKSAPRNAGKRV